MQKLFRFMIIYLILWSFSNWYYNVANLHYSIIVLIGIWESSIIGNKSRFANFQESEKGLILNQFSMFDFLLFLHLVDFALYFPHAAIESILYWVIASANQNICTWMARIEWNLTTWNQTRCTFGTKCNLIQESIKSAIDCFAKSSRLSMQCLDLFILGCFCFCVEFHSFRHVQMDSFIFVRFGLLLPFRSFPHLHEDKSTYILIL